MARAQVAVQRVVRPQSWPFGTQKVGTIRSSTGIYGRKVGGAKTRSDAVRVRKGRR